MQNAASDNSTSTVRPDLTDKQHAPDKARTGKAAESLELGVDELEQRIAPARKIWRV